MKNLIQFALFFLLFSACNKNTIDIMGNDFSAEEKNEQLATYLDDLVGGQYQRSFTQLR